MSLRNKLGEELTGVEHDPVQAYRLWRDPNETYRDLTLRPLVTAKEAAKEELPSRSSLMGTIGFLVALLVVGFVAGYALRGDAYANGRADRMANMSIGTIAAPASLETDDQRSTLLAMLGSQAPDELMSLETSTTGNMTALVKLHDTSADGEDRFSVLNVTPNGEFEEILRQEVGSGGMAVSRFNSGGLVVASVNGDVLDIHGLNANGREDWTRKFGVAEGHAAGVQVLSTSFGAVIAGPTDRLDRIGITYLGLDGSMLWQRSFAVDTKAPDLMLKSARDGSIFVSMRGNDVTQPSHSLIRIDLEGQDLWRTNFSLGAGTVLSGLSPSGDEGVYLLSTGAVPSLTKYDAFGQVAWDVLVPQAKLFNSIDLLSSDDGNAVIAISYGLTPDRQDVLIEQRDSLGLVTAQSTFSLPGLSSVDVVKTGGAGHYIIAGSVLPDRFEDADVFVKDVEFRPTMTPFTQPEPRVLASATPVQPDPAPQPLAAAIEPIVPESLAISPEPVVSRAPVGTDTVETAAADTSVEAEAVERPPEATTPEPAAQPDASAATTPNSVDEPSNDGAAISGFVSEPVTIDAGEEIELAGGDMVDEPVVIEAAQSLDPNIIIEAQCRFSCLDHAGSTSAFPMWRSVRVARSAIADGVPEQHAQTCQAAGGVANLESKPACQGF